MRYVTAAFLTTMLLGCGGSGERTTEPPPVPPVANAITLVSGTNQTGTVGERLPQKIGVRVVSTGGAGVGGVVVTFSSITNQASASPSTATTDVNGVAETTWILGTLAGTQSLGVVAKNSAGTRIDSANVSATAAAGPPVRITVSSGRTLIGFWGDTTHAAAAVVDRFENPILGPVTWSSADPAVVRVDATGVVTGIRGGTANIIATIPSLTTGVPITVGSARTNSACTLPGAVVPGTPSSSVPAFSRQEVFDPPGLRYSIPEVRVLDIDGDGIDELLVFNSNFAQLQSDPQGGEVRVWKLQGGRYTDVTAAALPAGPLRADHTRAYATGDFDGDGHLDLFVGQHGFDGPPYPGAPNFLLISHADGTLTNAAPSAMNPYEPNNYTHGAAAADVNCDGSLDIFTSTLPSQAAPAQPHLWINSGGAQFRTADQNVGVAFSGQPMPTYTSAEFCDLDRDGDADLVLGGWNPFVAFPSQLLVNDGWGGFRLAPQGTLPAPPFTDANTTTLEIRCVDIDRDGWNDLVASVTDRTYSRGALVVWKNNQNGTFIDATTTVLPNADRPAEWIGRIYVTDFNRDGWPDLYMSGLPIGPAAGVADLYINSGGHFSYSRPPVDLAAFSSPIRTTTSGRLDIVFLTYGPGATVVPVILQSNLP